jgi:hypothetical protein
MESLNRNVAGQRNDNLTPDCGFLGEMVLADLEIIAIRPHFNRVNKIALIDGHGGVYGLSVEIGPKFVGIALC